MKTSPISAFGSFLAGVLGKAFSSWRHSSVDLRRIRAVDPDDGNGGYYSDNTPAAAVGNGAFRMQEFESR